MRFMLWVSCLLTLAAYGDYAPPDWGTPPTTVTHAYDGAATTAENGAALKTAVLALQAGQRIAIEGGTYYIGSHFGPTLNGVDGAPIVIEGAGPGEVVIETDPKHNGLDLNGAYIVLRNVSITGASEAIRIHDCHHVLIENCHIHDCPDGGITTNTLDTNNIHIINNEIDHVNGEGMYLGANYGEVIMHTSYIVGNYVHDIGAPQGDGIELKQGSWGNLIADNWVHDTNYPCIIAYGTADSPRNVIERNRCYRSNDNTMQVQGEALVRNNLAVSGAGSAFQSHDHQAASTALEVINNTFINAGRAVNLSNWDGRAGMVFANNACYSRDGEGLRFPAGSTGVAVAGNVVMGAVEGVAGGYSAGAGLAEDFVAVSWDASSLDAHPTATSALLDTAEASYLPEEDLSGAARTGSTAGAYERPADPADYHDADLNQDHRIDLSELLRLVQFLNVGGYYPCEDPDTPDGFCPGIEGDAPQLPPSSRS